MKTRSHTALSLWTGALALSVAIVAQCQLADTPHNPFVGDPAAVTAGEKIFSSTCTVCHGEGAVSGRGPALNTGRFTHGSDDYDLFQVIRSGVTGTQMPSFAALPSDDIWRAVTYIKSLSGRSSGSEVAPGDPVIGEQLFYGPAGCSTCHEVNGRGSAVAADLSSEGLSPVKAIRAGVRHEFPANVRTARHFADVTTREGKVIRGSVVAEDSFSIALLVGARSVVLDKDPLRNVSVTPDALPHGVTLSDADIDNMTAWLSTKRRRDFAQTAQVAPPPVLAYSRLAAGREEPHNYLTYWGGYDGHHFSELKQIEPGNVSRLQARWSALLPGQVALESSPLVVDGIMYVGGPPGDVYALDAKSGLLLWRFSRKQDVVNPYQINPVNRGVAVLDGRVFFGTLDDNLIALDAHTGRELWEVRVADTLDGYGLTGAPLALDGKLIVGCSGGDIGLRGFLDAYDPATGKQLWRFNTVAAPGEVGGGTWQGDSWKRGGGGTWLTGSYDPELNLLYWAVGNPAPPFNAAVREGDNLFSDSVVALNPDTGELRWWYQFTPHDSHDWDSEEDLILADQVVAGKKRKVLLHADRNGVFYVLDRTNGQFLWARPFVKTNWVRDWSPTGAPVVDRSTEGTPQGTIVWPAVGGTNFQSPSYDRESKILYLPYLEAQGWANSGPPVFERGRAYTGRGAVPSPPAPPPKPGIMALDTTTGEMKWRFPVMKSNLSAGLIGTRGGVVFAGTAEGQFMALDQKTGRPLWHFRTGGPITASPMSYAVSGEQFIAIAAGNTVYAFALPR
jgi:alcohol dehydrogenase (cytochrome c)